jgi:hypothetical protein
MYAHFIKVPLGFESQQRLGLVLIVTASRPALGAHTTSYPMCARGSFPRKSSGRVVKLTTHLHLMPRLRMRGAVPPLPHTSSWRGALSLPYMLQPRLWWWYSCTCYFDSRLALLWRCFAFLAVISVCFISAEFMRQTLQVKKCIIAAYARLSRR